MAFNNEQINAIIREDERARERLHEDYSPEICDLIDNNFHNIRTSLIVNSQRFCSEVQYRFSGNRPNDDSQSRNFWPQPIGYHRHLINFIRSVLLIFFASTGIAIYINFAVSSCVIDIDNDNFQFFWASRSNFPCLNTAYLIHSLSTLNYFVDQILSKYDLAQYMADMCEILEVDYEGDLLPLSLHLFTTRCTSKIFGYKHIDRPLSSNKCRSSDGRCIEANCVWDCLSAILEINKYGIPSMRQNKRRGRPNKIISKKLRLSFLNWFRQKKLKHGYFNQPMTKFGFSEEFFPLLEEFLGFKLVLFRENRVQRKKVGYNSLKKCNRITRCLFLRYSSSMEGKKTLFMASSQDSGHIRLIKDVMAYSNKYICMNCLKSYSEKRYLDSHSCKKISFRCESVYKWRPSLSHFMQFEPSLKKRLFMDLKFCHILINRKAVTGAIEIEAHFSLLGEDNLILKRLYANLEAAAKFITDVCIQAAFFVLSERMRLNFEWLKHFEDELNATLSNGPLKFNPIRSQRLKDMKEKFVQFLSEYSTYIQCGTEDLTLCPEMMNALLSHLCQKYSAEKIVVKFFKNSLQIIKVAGFPVKFICLNSFGSSFRNGIAKYADTQTFKSIVLGYMNEFKVNIVGLESDAMIGNEMLSNCLNVSQQRSFYTPSKTFYNLTHDVNVKYGLIMAKSQVIHPESAMKSAISMDYERFYFRICTMEKAPWMCEGMGINYKKNDKGVFNPERNRRRQTLANLLLILVEFVLQVETISLLNGKEARVGNYLVDAVLYLGHKMVLLEICGCSHHAHNLICHLSLDEIKKIDPLHKLNCLLCQASNVGRANFLRPALWRLRESESRSSCHYFHKNLSYDQVYAKTEEKQKSLRENGFNLISIFECQISKFWHSTIGEFFDQINLPVKAEFRGEIFSTLFQNLALKHFPMLGTTTLTKNKIVDAIKCGKINGFAKVTASLGPSCKNKLEILAPFFFKDAEKKSVKSFEVVEKLIPIVLLRELLTNSQLADFKIHKLHEVIEYRQILSTNPFHQLRRPVLDCLERNKSSPFCKHLKASLNSSIGLLSYNGFKRRKSVMATSDDIMALNDLTHFSHCTKVDNDNAILHFQSKSAVSNLSSLHLSLIGYGVKLVIEFFLKLKYFCPELSLARVNCDGLSFSAPIAHPKSILKCSTITSVCLDTFLRPDMDHFLAKQYFLWKQSYFSNIGVCHSHAYSYIQYLAKKGKHFYQNECCLKAKVSNEICFPMKFECVADLAIIRSVNQCCFINTETGEKMVKSGGRLDERFQRIQQMSLSELQEMLQ